jgi:hypothetical protein
VSPGGGVATGTGRGVGSPAGGGASVVGGRSFGGGGVVSPSGTPGLPEVSVPLPGSKGVVAPADCEPSTAGVPVVDPEVPDVEPEPELRTVAIDSLCEVPGVFCTVV